MKLQTNNLRHNNNVKRRKECAVSLPEFAANVNLPYQTLVSRSVEHELPEHTFEVLKNIRYVKFYYTSDLKRWLKTWNANHNNKTSVKETTK